MFMRWNISLLQFIFRQTCKDLLHSCSLWFELARVECHQKGWAGLSGTSSNSIVVTYDIRILLKFFICCQFIIYILLNTVFACESEDCWRQPISLHATLAAVSQISTHRDYIWDIHISTVFILGFFFLEIVDVVFVGGQPVPWIVNCSQDPNTSLPLSNTLAILETHKNIFNCILYR